MERIEVIDFHQEVRFHRKRPPPPPFAARARVAPSSEPATDYLTPRHQEQTQVDIDGIKVTPYRAGHVLGACMFYVDIGGLRALYTGDYSRTPDRHLPGADLPSDAAARRRFARARTACRRTRRARSVSVGSRTACTRS